MVRGKKIKPHDMRRPVVSPSGWMTVRGQLHGGCIGKTGKIHYVMKPSCGWISARGQYPKKITVVKNFDRRKNLKMSKV